MLPSLQIALHSPSGFAHTLVCFESVIISLFAITISARILILAIRTRDKLSITQAILQASLMPTTLLTIAVILSFSSLPLFGENGKTILSFSPLNPGSNLARASLFGAPFWISRIFQPSICLVILVASLLTTISAPRNVLGKIAIASWLTAIYLEVIYVLDPFFLHLEFFFSLEDLKWVDALEFLIIFPILHFVVLQIFLLCLFNALLRIQPKLAVYPWRSTSKEALRLFGRSFAYLILLLLPCVLIEKTTPTVIWAGAHYYSWFPENWRAGKLGDYTIPQIKPKLGNYSTLGSKVFRQHVAWARKANLKYFIFDYWPRNTRVRSRVKRLARRVDAMPNFNFTLQYEPLDLKEPGDPLYPGEGPNIIYIDKTRTDRLMKHWLRIAKYYMTNPSYLRVGTHGRPVLFLYSTRHMIGQVSEAIQKAKDFVLEHTNEDIFLIGDEVYFNVLDYKDGVGTYMNKEFVPNWSRLSVFDAITCYNPYESHRIEYGGNSGANVFLDSTQHLFSIYNGYANTLGQPFIPVAMPGYNDRGVRIAENHYVVPRDFKSTDVSGRMVKQSFFKQSLEKWVEPFMKSGEQLIAITSWNEWNEWTSIEPSKRSPKTTVDNSSNSNIYTLGVSHFGYGNRHLSELKHFIEKNSAK